MRQIQFGVFHLGDFTGQDRGAEATAVDLIGHPGAGKEVLARNPAFTVQSWTLAAPYKNEADLERELDGLCKAGLPE